MIMRTLKQVEVRPPIGATLWRGPVRHLSHDKMVCVWWVLCPKCENVRMANSEQVSGHSVIACDVCDWYGLMQRPLTKDVVEIALGRMSRGRRELTEG